ncbi:hypothetical protein [Nocardia sp. NPDC047648]|uniref:hypothetical protein n=1 Tax=Nocardia sp. NPDC047648 TaxID=3155625 RepID=UPI0033F54450
MKRALVGAERIATFVRLAIKPTGAKWDKLGGKPTPFAAIVNGRPALILVAEDRIVGVVVLELTADGIAATATVLADLIGLSDADTATCGVLASWRSSTWPRKWSWR